MDPRLYQAARLGDLDAFKSLLEEDSLLLEKVALSSSADTPLHISTLAGKTGFAKEMILRMPSFAWELNQDGFSPLHIATATGNVEITENILSLDSGLCLVKDKLGRTPLHWAAIKGRVEIARELISHCYEAVKEVSSKGETALHLAVKNNQCEVLKVLVGKLGEDDRDRVINAQDDQGNTILQLAVAKGLVHAQNLFIKNQSKQDKEVAESSSPQDIIQHHQPRRTDHLETLPINESKTVKFKQLWVESEDMILVVASLIATVTYQAGLSPPPTIWQQGMKLNFDCMFRKKQKISLSISDPAAAADTCPAFTFYFFMSFNTAGFFSSIFLIFLFRNRTFAAVLLPTSLSCMAVTYVALSLSMSPNAVTFLIIYLITIMLLVYFLFAVNALQAMLHGVSI